MYPFIYNFQTDARSQNLLQIYDKNITKEEKVSKGLNERKNTWEVLHTHISFFLIKFKTFFSEDTQNTTHTRENKICLTYISFP